MSWRDDLTVALVGVLLSATAAIQSAVAQSSCDASILAALRTTYKDNTFNSLDEAVRQISSSQGSGNYVIGYEGLELSASKKNNASADNSSTLSYRNKVDVALSFLPEAGFETVRDVCSGPGLSVSANEVGGNVTLTFNFRGGLGLYKTRVQGLSFTRDAFDCDLSALRKNPIIKVDTPRVATCVRKARLPAVFSLTTDVGDAFARLAVPDQKHFWLLVGTADDEITCNLNGDEVVHRGITGGTMFFDLTSRLHHGKNVLFCHPHDVYGAEGGPCWNYHVELYLALRSDSKPEDRDESYIESPGKHCGKGTQWQPDDFSIPFIWQG